MSLPNPAVGLPNQGAGAPTAQQIGLLAAQSVAALGGSPQTVGMPYQGTPTLAALGNACLLQNGSNLLSTCMSAANATKLQSGALTANVPQLALSLSGSGRLNWGGVMTNDATSRTIRAILVVDGRTVRDFTSASMASVGAGFIFLGAGYSNGSGFAIGFQPIDFKQNVSIYIASSLTESGSIWLGVNYEAKQ